MPEDKIPEDKMPENKMHDTRNLTPILGHTLTVTGPLRLSTHTPLSISIHTNTLHLSVH